jgi:hypothetical protein
MLPNFHNKLFNGQTLGLSRSVCKFRDVLVPSVCVFAFWLFAGFVFPKVVEATF